MRKEGDLLYLLLEQFSVWNGYLWLDVLKLDFEVSELVKITAFSIQRMFLMVHLFVPYVPPYRKNKKINMIQPVTRKNISPCICLYINTHCASHGTITSLGNHPNMKVVVNIP